ncbi:MAG: glycosyltransferase family 4 protein [Armatimonadetes bacterium]|nr:glycosyltransferase family 4 protein [Armatimonadota bacterium]
MRVLLALHHQLDPNQGAPGATLSLGQALEAAGCEVEYFGFEHAYPKQVTYSVKHAVQFPWRLAAFLSRCGSRFDIIDASTGDSWVWAAQRRPGACECHALITRSHGLEHAVDQQVRATAKGGGTPLSWKYPVYHGGYRLWEVKKSLQQADHCILLNEADCRYVCNNFHVPSERVSVTPMGISDRYCGLPPPARRADPKLRLAFVGSWIPRKGTKTMVETVMRLRRAGLDFALSIFGSGKAPVWDDFSATLHERLDVRPEYRNAELPSLLLDHDILLCPSLAEGFSRALVEAMACGLAPIATPVGAAPSVIETGKNGILVPVNASSRIADAVLHLASHRDVLFQIQCEAQNTAQAYRWDTLAANTISIYESARNRPTA